MTRDAARILVASIASLGALALLLWLFLDRDLDDVGSSTAPEKQETWLAGNAVTLLFPSAGGRLSEEIRELPAVIEPEVRIRQTVEALLAGPEQSGLYAPLPAGISLGSVFLAGDGTAFLDLITGEGVGTPSWGSKQELLAVYSLVNTVLTNEPQARRVTLLWNGQQRSTFAGHVDLTRPLTLHSGLIAPKPAPVAEGS